MQIIASLREAKSDVPWPKISTRPHLPAGSSPPSSSIAKFERKPIFEHTREGLKAASRRGRVVVGPGVVRAVFCLRGLIHGQIPVSESDPTSSLTKPAPQLRGVTFSPGERLNHDTLCATKADKHSCQCRITRTAHAHPAGMGYHSDSSGCLSAQCAVSFRL